MLILTSICFAHFLKSNSDEYIGYTRVYFTKNFLILRRKTVPVGQLDHFLFFQIFYPSASFTFLAPSLPFFPARLT